MRIRGNIPFSKIARIFSTFDPSTLIPGIFASKTDGNDSDDGLTEATAKETLDPGIEAIDSANAVVGLYYGDEWNEQYDPGVDGIKLIPYGTPANGLPIISGMDVITGWTLVAAMTNAYEKSVTHSVGAAANYNYLMVAEIDETDESTQPYTAYNFLRRVADVATCESTAGSFYAPNPVTGSTDTVTIHPSDSGNPNSNGKRYEVTTREFCVNNFIPAGYGYNNLVLYKFILKLSGDGYGQVGAGNDAWVQQCLFLGSGTHSIVIKDGTIDQCVFIDGPAGLATSYQVTFYQENSIGKKCYLKNSIFYSTNNSSFYAHNSLGESYKYDTIHVSNCKFYNFGQSIALSCGAETDNLIIEDCYIEDGAYGVYVGAANVTIRNCIIKDADQGVWLSYPTNPSQSITVENCLIITNDSSSGSSNPYLFNRANPNCDITITNCIIHAKSTYSGAQNVGMQVFRDLASNSVTFNNNIIIGDVAAGKMTLILNAGDRNGGGPAGLQNVSADNNVYIRLSGAYSHGIAFRFTNPVSGYLSFSDWKLYGGQDANSLYYDYLTLTLSLDDLFTDPSNGDWTLNSSSIHKSAIEAIGAGMTTPPTSYPSTLTKEQAVTKMIAGDLATESIWG